MTEKDTLCHGCGFSFYIEYDEDIAEIRYCPACGDELFEELDFED